MPVYEYACKACDFEFEREQRITDKPVKKCPRCGALQAKRLISRTSFVLKGGGWYSDLYAKPSPKGDAKAEGGGSDTTEKAAGGAESGAGASGESAGKAAPKEGAGGEKKGGKGSTGSGKKGSKASKGPPAAAA